MGDIKSPYGISGGEHLVQEVESPVGMFKKREEIFCHWSVDYCLYLQCLSTGLLNTNFIWSITLFAVPKPLLCDPLHTVVWVNGPLL